MRRRALLWVVVGTTWILVTIQFRRLLDTLIEIAKPRVDTALPPDKLSPAEISTVLAFAEVLVSDRPLSAAERGPLVEHIIDRALGAPGFLSLYRGTARLLDGLTARSFAELPRTDREALVQRLRLADTRVSDLEYFRPFHRESLLTRQFVVADLIAAYFTSPPGWAVIGYDTCPGQCVDLVRYTRAER